MAAKLLSLLLGCGVVAVASGGLPCTVYPDAIFSPDGEWIYYVQSEMSGSFRSPSLQDNVPNKNFAKERIEREVITIHRKHRESERDEVVKSIPTPPWLGVEYPATDCGEYRYASLVLKPDGDISYEFFGPSFRPHVDLLDTVITEELLVYREAEGKWTKTPFNSLYRRPVSNRNWKNLELVRYDDEWWWLVDHANHSYKVILAGSKNVKKNASNFTLEKILALTQPTTR